MLPDRFRSGGEAWSDEDDASPSSEDNVFVVFGSVVILVVARVIACRT